MLYWKDHCDLSELMLLLLGYLPVWLNQLNSYKYSSLTFSFSLANRTEFPHQFQLQQICLHSYVIHVWCQLIEVFANCDSARFGRSKILLCKDTLLAMPWERVSVIREFKKLRDIIGQENIYISSNELKWATFSWNAHFSQNPMYLIKQRV